MSTVNPRFIVKRSGAWVLCHNPDVPPDRGAVILATDYPDAPNRIRSIVASGTLESMELLFAVSEPPAHLAGRAPDISLPTPPNFEADKF